MMDSFDPQTYRSFMKVCQIPGLPIVFLTIHNFFPMQGFQTRDESHRKLKEERERGRKQERKAHRVDFCLRHKRKTMKHRCKGLLALCCIPDHMPLARPALRFVAKSPTKCKFKRNQSGCWWSVCSIQTVMFMRETRKTTSTSDPVGHVEF